MYIPRELKKTAIQAVKNFPAILITGPRQSGKTTFLQREFSSDSYYITFDDPLQRQFATQDPNGFLDQFIDRPVILDEIQYVPQLFSYLKIRIDSARHKKGRFLMTGSQQFQLMKNISDSLAGRIAILELLPFSFAEIIINSKQLDIAQRLWIGNYPDPVLNPEQRELWLSAYLRTYIERDVRQLQNIRDLSQFEQFLTLIAACHSQELNTAKLSRSCGLSLPGCKKWLSVLEASYILYFLKPFYNNFGKRLIKRPKCYFIDSSIASYLTRQPSSQAMWHGAMSGAFFEGFIISETVKFFTNLGKRPDIYFWRSNDGLEIDMLIQKGDILYPVEIKKTATPNIKHTEAIKRFRNLTGKQSENGIIVCTVEKETMLTEGIRAIPWAKYIDWLKSIIP